MVVSLLYVGKSFSLKWRKISPAEKYFPMHLSQSNIRKLENIFLYTKHTLNKYTL